MVSRSLVGLFQYFFYFFSFAFFRLCSNRGAIEQKQVKGLKMLFSNGQLLKTNVNYQDNEFEYYRLVGEAYNAHKLDRVSVESKQVQLLQSGDGK